MIASLARSDRPCNGLVKRSLRYRQVIYIYILKISFKIRLVFLTIGRAFFSQTPRHPNIAWVSQPGVVKLCAIYTALYKVAIYATLQMS